MSEIDRFREYVAALCGHRRIPTSMRDALCQLLQTPRIRGRFSSLTWEQMKAVADTIVTGETQPATRWRRRKSE